MQQLNLLNNKTKTDIAIEFIREHEPPEGYFFGDSGGKDSTVLRDLVIKSGVQYESYYSATGIDPPELVKFIREYHPETIFKRPHYTRKRQFPDWPGTRSFFGMLQVQGFPMRHVRWCCNYLKKAPTMTIPLYHRILGLRAEESANRAKRPVIENYKKQTIYKPIFYWKEWEIWEFIEMYKLPYPKLYNEGFDRIGCVICPNHHNRHEPYRKRWPNHFKCFERYVTSWWNKRIVQGKEM